MLEIRPISIPHANEYVEMHHRHHGKKNGCRFAISVYEGEDLHGVAICSNPVGIKCDDGLTLEVSRLCTDGTRNACSILYGACARIAKEMGFRKIQTYILESESVASLKASGWTMEAEECGKPSWNYQPSQRQKERSRRPSQLSLFEKKTPPEEYKIRWVRYLKGDQDDKG